MRFDLNNPFKKQQALEFFNKLFEKLCIIEIKEIKLKRSLDQNSLLWLWCTCIQEEIGLDKTEVYLLYRAMFLTKPDERINNIIRTDLWEKLKILIFKFHYFKGLDEIINVIAYNTSELDTTQFKNFLDKIKDHALINMNITLISLDDKNFSLFYNAYLENL